MQFTAQGLTRFFLCLRLLAVFLHRRITASGAGGAGATAGLLAWIVRFRTSGRGCAPNTRDSVFPRTADIPHGKHNDQEKYSADNPISTVHDKFLPFRKFVFLYRLRDGYESVIASFRSFESARTDNTTKQSTIAAVIDQPRIGIHSAPKLPPVMSVPKK